MERNLQEIKLEETNLEETIALLAHTPAALDALLRGLPEGWTRCHEGEGTWTVFDVVGHLIDCDRVNWMPRARLIRDSQACGDAEPLQSFQSFDRDGHLREGTGKYLAELLDAFALIRAKNLAELRAWDLQPAELAMRALHPAFGVVTLSQLLATWAAHDLTHVHQISRIMASRYREAVGPWVQYLGVLQCNGHSA